MLVSIIRRTYFCAHLLISGIDWSSTNGGNKHPSSLGWPKITALTSDGDDRATVSALGDVAELPQNRPCYRAAPVGRRLNTLEVPRWIVRDLTDVALTQVAFDFIVEQRLSSLTSQLIVPLNVERSRVSAWVRVQLLHPLRWDEVKRIVRDHCFSDVQHWALTWHQT